jgi:GT2 family glycosyltransferase
VASISVIIPAFNAGSYLAEAIKSAWSQTRQPREVLVVDDGSTDGTPELAERSGARVLRTSRNLGPAGARNTGIRAAEGDYVAFLDADDRWRPQHLAVTGEALDRYPDAVLACAGVTTFGDRSEDFSPNMPHGTPVRCEIELAVRNPVYQLTAVARRAALAQVGGYDETMRHAEDYDLWQRLSRVGPFVFLGEITAEYRAHGGQTSRARLQMLRGGWSVRHRAWQELSQALPAAAVAALRRELTEEWSRDLTAAWRERSSEPVRFVLAQGAWVPDGDELYRRWSWKLRYARPVWRGAAFLVDTARRLRG